MEPSQTYTYENQMYGGMFTEDQVLDMFEHDHKMFQESDGTINININDTDTAKFIKKNFRCAPGVYEEYIMAILKGDPGYVSFALGEAYANFYIYNALDDTDATRFHNAIKHYNDACITGIQCQYEIGECYNRLHDYHKAEDTYKNTQGERRIMALMRLASLNLGYHPWYKRDKKDAVTYLKEVISLLEKDDGTAELS
jgi:tetratricopeptide (TPR) repeat protein